MPGQKRANYVFDLTRRAQGLVLVTRAAEALNQSQSPLQWQCSATDDADAVQQALKAAESEWPPVPGRKFNDFIVKFVD